MTAPSIISMTTYESNATLAELADRILAADRILITTHVKPDGDAMGSVLALGRALSNKGKSADIYLMGPIEPNLLTIAGQTPLHRVEQKHPDDDAYDLAIVVDTGAWGQLEPLEPWLRRHHDRVIGIDHHTRGDDVASKRIVWPQAVSTTAIIAALLDEMGCELTGGVGGVAEPLFVGLATDSGWFRFGNAGPEAFELAARLLRAGVDKSRLYQVVEENFTPQRLALQAKALASLEYVRHGTVAIQLLRPEDFASTGGGAEDMTGLVNAPMVVATVRVSILLSQTEAGLTKASFRSKPAPPDAEANDFIDVNQLAQRFGGGGHVHAAGARLPMDIDAAKAAIIEQIEALN